MIEHTRWQNALDGKFQDREHTINFFKQRPEDLKKQFPQKSIDT